MSEAENRFSYAPETIAEQYAFMAGRIAALEAYLDKENSQMIFVDTVRTFLGIEKKGKSDGRG